MLFTIITRNGTRVTTHVDPEILENICFHLTEQGHETLAIKLIHNLFALRLEECKRLVEDMTEMAEHKATFEE